MRRIGSPGLAQRIVLLLGLAAGLIVLGRYLETLGHQTVSFGWFAYAPLNSTVYAPFRPHPPSVDLAIWAGASVVWALASLRLIGSILGRRIVLIVALAGVLTALGQYLLTLGAFTSGNALNGSGLQYLSSGQRSQYASIVNPGGRLEVWLGLAVVWTIGSSLLLLRRTRPPSDGHPQQPYPNLPRI